MKLGFSNVKVLICTECGSPRLNAIGDVLQCIDCGNCRALG